MQTDADVGVVMAALICQSRCRQSQQARAHQPLQGGIHGISLRLVEGRDGYGDTYALARIAIHARGIGLPVVAIGYVVAH